MSALHKKSTAFRRIVRLLPLLIGGAFASLPAFSASASTEQWAPGRLLVQPKPGLPDAVLAKILKSHGAKSVGKINGIDVHVVELATKGSEKAMAALLAHNPHVAFAELDMVVRPAATADDPYFSSAWHLQKLNIPSAWDVANGTGVVVAVLDSGVDGGHPDLVNQMVPGWNFYDNNANTSDVNGHGTQVAGAVAASTNNSIGVSAVAPGAKIMPVRISLPDGTAYYSTMASGLTWAANNGAKVANISYQSVSGSSTVANAALYLKNKGGVTVVAAGNTGVEQTFAPTDAMLSVSATDASDNKASWSSFGSYVDIAAPGVGILSTTAGGGYAAVSGTSFSSPITAGVVALMMNANAALSPTDIEQLLFGTATDLGDPGKDKLYGNGRVNASAAVQAAASATALDITSPTTSFGSPALGSVVRGVTNISINASDDVSVARVELWANGTLVGTDYSAPYEFSWDTTQVPDGGANLYAYAFDTSGNYGSSARSVTVSNAADTQPPTVVISNPNNGTAVSGTVTINGQGIDNVGLDSLTLFVDGKAVLSTAGTTLTYKWNTRKVAAGGHLIELVAVDSSGNVGRQAVTVSR
ncbi:MAG: S8 family serine peptidase [Zoogloeaceae bacterium]|nr:S8 family serine peptidase [Zoogloeaceae bacterium]